MPRGVHYDSPAMGEREDLGGRRVPWEPSAERSAAGDPAASSEDLRPGVVLLSRFRILEDLGEGGLGRVFKARDERFETDVLVKVVKESLATHSQLIDHFRREILVGDGRVPGR